MREAEKPRKVSVGGMCWIVIGFIIIVIGISIYLWMKPRAAGWAGMPLTILVPIGIVIIILSLIYITWKANRIAKGSSRA